MGARFSPFWTAQLLGWGAYALVNHLVAPPALVAASGGALLHLGQKLVKAAMGGGFSLLLHALYGRLWPRRPPLLGLGLLAVTLSLAFGSAWLALFRRVGLGLSALGPDFGRESLNYGFVLLAWSALYFSFSYRRELEVEAERVLRANALASEARLRMLRYQVNPHFLFNALNSIRALIREDPDRACRTVTELAEFFRYSLLDTQGSDATLRHELEAVKNYLAIQKTRFEERLEVDLRLDPRTEGLRIPGFLIHPLVENAVKYGMETSLTPLRVRLVTALDQGALRVEVANTGRWVHASELRSPAGTGTGLQNVRERLQQAYPGRHLFDVAERDGWVRASIEIRGAADGGPG